MLGAGTMLSSFGYSAPSTSATPSQIVILGMHHSATSLVSNMTMQMGAYGGETDELLLHPDNPLKYWERRDVVALDEARLDAGVSAITERYDLPSWVAYGFDAAKAAPKVQDSAEAKAIVNKLNEKRPWVTKDPRMSLVAAEWMQLLDAPVCVIVHRDPLSVANSMMIYSHNVSLAEWSSVYENYYASAMRACEGVRRRPFAPPRSSRASRVWGVATHAPYIWRGNGKGRETVCQGMQGERRSLNLVRRLTAGFDPVAEADRRRAARGDRQGAVPGDLQDAR